MTFFNVMRTVYIFIYCIIFFIIFVAITIVNKYTIGFNLFSYESLFR